MSLFTLILKNNLYDYFMRGAVVEWIEYLVMVRNVAGSSPT